MKGKQRTPTLSIVCGAVAGGTLSLFVLPLLGQGHTSEDMTKAAFEAFNKDNYKAAIERAEDCIYNFENAAKRQQSQLAQHGEKQPPTGEVSPEERKLIVKRGVLNDVATCLWIKGRSAEYLYQRSKEKDTSNRDQAIAAYQAACGLTYARTWDPKGWFWSPAEAAADGLTRLHSQCP